MGNMDTVKLLQECHSGVKMGTESIDEVLDHVCNTELKRLLTETREHHEKLENEIDDLLKKYKADEKEPGLMAKGMSWMKTNVKLTMEHSDATIAELMTDGANMGVKSLNQCLNEYQDADEEAKQITGKLIKIEEKLCKELQKYL